ncbi:MAG: winged helix-turn-helix domain-containing protein [Bryobacteraceae bacterium]
MPKRPATYQPVELDLDRYELRRAGRRVDLERIPMELLILLAENPGRLLTRDEIVSHLWGKNPWLDPERNVNTAISKIRRALCDDAGQPSFVETVIGKGYRFTASTQHRDSGMAAGPIDSSVRLLLLRSQKRPVTIASTISTAAAVTLDAAVGSPQPYLVPTPVLRLALPPHQEAIPAVPSYARRRWLWAGAMLTVAAAIGVALWTMRPRSPVAMVEGYDQITRDVRRKALRIGEIPLPILTDGSRLYYSLTTPRATFEVGQVAATGGETASLATELPSPIALDVSRDGSEMLVMSPAGLPATPLWVQPIPGGPPHPLAGLEGQSGSWSPDGQTLAVAGRDGLYLSQKDGSRARPLVGVAPTTGEEIYWPRWSPDGKTVRYSVFSPKNGFHSLWEVSAEGSNPHPLLRGWNPVPHECCGSWTPDGNYFVFASVRNGRSDIWAIPKKTGPLGRDQSRPVRITAGPIGFYAPLPSAAGRLYVMGAEPRGELVRYDPRSDTRAPWLAGISANGVSYSRDGEWVAYTSYPEAKLWRSRADGTERLQLTPPQMHVSLPRWSPDGRWIAFYARMPGRPVQIYLVPAAGGPTELLHAASNQQIDPSWSADGNSLVFERAPWEQRGGGRATEIDLIDVKTRNISVLPGSEGLVSPRWSPDGRFIAAMPSDSSGLVLFNVRSQTWKKLIQLRIGYPNWSHDGKYIYFDRFSKPKGIGRVRVSDGSIESILTAKMGDEIWNIDSWTGLSPDDSVLLLRDAGIEEIYALRWSMR